MVLDQERLISLMREMNDGILEKLHQDLRRFRGEYEYLEKEGAHDEVILEVALRSPQMGDGNGSSGRSDLASLENSIAYCVREQKEVLQKCIRQCMDKQLVVYHIFHVILQLEEEKKKILMATLNNSLDQAIEALRKDGILIGKRRLIAERDKVRDWILQEVNREIRQINDFER